MIGRTSVALFDPSAEPPTLLRPGDNVRCVPQTGGPMLKIIHAGLHTSVQDAGRHHLRHLGISQSGALDTPALRIANLLVGNAMSEAGLEITLGKLAATFTSPC